MKSYTSGLAWLLATLILPVLLLAALVFGSPFDSSKLFASATGIFAYVWLLAGLVIAGKPTWLHAASARLAQVALLIASLPLALAHSSISPTTGWASLTGVLALVSLVAAGLYSLLYWASQRLATPQPSPRVTGWANRLTFVAALATFAHVQLIDSIRANLVFMLAFYALSLPVFLTFSWKKAGAADHKTADQAQTA